MPSGGKQSLKNAAHAFKSQQFCLIAKSGVLVMRQKTMDLSKDEELMMSIYQQQCMYASDGDAAKAEKLSYSQGKTKWTKKSLWKRFRKLVATYKYEFCPQFVKVVQESIGLPLEGKLYATRVRIYAKFLAASKAKKEKRLKQQAENGGSSSSTSRADSTEKDEDEADDDVQDEVMPYDWEPAEWQGFVKYGAPAGDAGDPEFLPERAAVPREAENSEEDSVPPSSSLGGSASRTLPASRSIQDRSIQDSGRKQPFNLEAVSVNEVVSKKQRIDSVVSHLKSLADAQHERMQRIALENHNIVKEQTQAMITQNDLKRMELELAKRQARIAELEKAVLYAPTPALKEMATNQLFFFICGGAQQQVGMRDSDGAAGSVNGWGGPL